MFINFGTILPLNTSEQLTLDSYQEIQSIIKTYIDKASKLDEYGNSAKATSVWEAGNKIIYLTYYLDIVRQRILKDYQNCNLQSFEYYKETYKLDCIQKTFSCLPIPFDVNRLYAIYGLDETSGFEGIEFMALEIDETVSCNPTTIFKVD